MTTQAEVTGSSQTAGTRIAKKEINWFWVMAIALSLVLIITTFVVIQLAGNSVDNNQRALEAMTARYQALADYHARQEIQLERYWSVTAARYQGLADLHAASETASLERYRLVTAARYQAMADAYAKKEIQLERYWTATAARYQAMAEAYLSEQDK